MFRTLRRLIERGRHPVQLSLDLDPPKPPQVPRSAERTHPADEGLVRKLRQYHSELNATRFGGQLRPIPIRVSRRMKSRLGHYVLRGQAARDAEIVISRRHIRRNGWDEAVHTLLHEMVHQWQDEAGLPVDHGRDFRRKAKAVGIVPRARRELRPAASTIFER